MQEILELAGYTAEELADVRAYLQDQEIAGFYESILERVDVLSEQEANAQDRLPDDIAVMSAEALDSEIYHTNMVSQIVQDNQAQLQDLVLLYRINTGIAAIEPPQMPNYNSANTKLDFQRAQEALTESFEEVYQLFESAYDVLKTNLNLAAFQPNVMQHFDNAVTYLEAVLSESNCDHVLYRAQELQAELFTEVSRLRSAIQKTRLEKAMLRVSVAIYESRGLCHDYANQFDVEIIANELKQLDVHFKKFTAELEDAVLHSSDGCLDSAEIMLFEDYKKLLQSIYNRRKESLTFFYHVQADVENRAEGLRAEYESIVNLSTICYLQESKIYRYFDQIQTLAQNIIKLKSQTAVQQMPPMELLAINYFFEALGADGTLQAAANALYRIEKAEQPSDAVLEAKVVEVLYQNRSICQALREMCSIGVSTEFVGYEELGYVCKALGV